MPSIVHSTRTAYLLSSYYSKQQFPHHQVPITYKAKGGFRALLNPASKYNKTPAVDTKELLDNEEQQAEKVVEWPWYGGAPPAFEDVTSAGTTSTAPLVDKTEQILHKPEGRNYVPLQNVFDIEFRGDHLVSAGLFEDALKHFGVAAKARQAAYPEGHLEITKILIKLARAFRLTGRPESAIANLERCLQNFEDSNPAAGIPVEQICEVILELGLAHRDLKSDEAGRLLEDVAMIANNYHDFGGSHRHIRLNVRKHKSVSLNFHNKFFYLSANDIDRTYTLVNLALVEAEDWYRSTKKDPAALQRVLQMRADVMDKKNFNMIYQAGRVRTWSGRNKNKRRFNTSNPTATELLAFSPTVHQVYHDYSRAHIAPLGREDEVQIAPGARYLDDADPFRHLRAESKSRQERQSAALEYLAQRDQRIADANLYQGAEAVQESLRK